MTLTDPGTPLAGAVTLQATSPDPDTARVDFQVSPAGAGVWTTVATDTSARRTPAASTRLVVSDGLYDFRAVARDAVGNVSAPSVVASRRIDNTPPSFVSATPADGSTVAGASSIAVTASEALSAVTGATLDGVATAAPAISGTDRDVRHRPARRRPAHARRRARRPGRQDDALHDPLHDRERPAAGRLALRRDERVPGCDRDARLDRRRRVGHDARRVCRLDRPPRAPDRPEPGRRRRRRLRHERARVRRLQLLVADRRSAARLLVAARDRARQRDRGSVRGGGDVRERSLAADPARPVARNASRSAGATAPSPARTGSTC